MRVATAAGERLGGVEVQFNVDQERSRELKLTPGGSGLPAGIYNDKDATYNYVAYADAAGLAPGTRFWDGSILTDGEGNAAGTLEIDAREAPGTAIVAVIDVLGQTETIVFRVE